MLIFAIVINVLAMSVYDHFHPFLSETSNLIQVR